MDVETIAIKGEWTRHAPHRSDPLGRAAEATDGRWQHGHFVRALYLADNAQTAIAEWYRSWPNAAYRQARQSRTTTTSGT